MYLFSNHFGILLTLLLSIFSLNLVNRSLAEGLVEELSDLVDELEGVEPLGAGGSGGVVHQDGQVLGHEAGFDGIDDGFLHDFAEVLELGVVVKLGTVEETTGPGVHGGDGVG